MLVKFFATYRDISGCKECDIPAPADVYGLLRELAQRWPGFREYVLDEAGTGKGDDAIVLVNGRHIDHTGGVATPLSEGDRVAVSPLMGGG